MKKSNRNQNLTTLGLIAATVTIIIGILFAIASSLRYYVSPTGSDSNSCTLIAPCATITEALSRIQFGEVATVNVLPGQYEEEVHVEAQGKHFQPIRIVGHDASLAGGFIFRDAAWVEISGFDLKGTDVFDVQENSHFLTIRDNRVEFLAHGVYVRGYSSHMLVEDNEFFQTCTLGSTWTVGKGSICDGGAFYGSSFGGGSYYIRNNYIHDVFNAVTATDSAEGQWMNANFFVCNNTIENVMDDPIEFEGDSFNAHFCNNRLSETHRLATFTVSGLGPAFVYGNVQIVTTNPTNEPERGNSALKLDLREGFANGIWIFNNTVDGIDGVNFTALDMLDPSLNHFTMANNVFLTENTVADQTPIFGPDAVLDYNLSNMPFGYDEAHGIVTDPMLNADGTLAENSPARGKAAGIVIKIYFENELVVPAGSDLGAFVNFPAPAWVLPPGGLPSQIPLNVPGWPEER